MPDEPLNISMVSQSRDCTIGWLPPKLPHIGRIEGYKIHVEQSLARSYEESPSQTGYKISIDQFKNKYTHKGLPNRIIEMGVQTVTHTCESRITWSSKCITEVAAPDTVAMPKIAPERPNDENTVLTVEIPRQTNGLLSCMFIIVSSGVDIARGYAINDLVKANKSIVVDEALNYIAASISVPNYIGNTGNQVNVVLGDEKVTQCNPFNASTNGRKKRSERKTYFFVGKSMKLDPNKMYNVVSVAAIPLRRRILLKQSKPLILDLTRETIDKESQRTLTYAIVGVLLLLLLVMIVIAGFLLRKRKRRTQETKQKCKRQCDSAIAGPNGNFFYENVDRNHVTIAEEVIYQNQVVNIQKNKRTETDIPMTDFEITYNEMLMDLGQIFSDQFRTLQQMAKQLSLSTSFASKDDLKNKNRYKNIIPFDENRVVIKLGDAGYINASFVDGFERKKKFIATQGPLKNSVGDFWAMIMEQNCSNIVMLAKCFEAGKAKCEKYWPELGKTTNYGKITIKNVSETKSCGFVCRNLRVSSELHMESLEVFQYHFLKWPDHGFPVTSSYIIRMHQEVMRSQGKGGSKSPTIVHCSAGAGRTGTFIGYDILLNEVKSMGNADVYQCVTKMRSQRPEMVQTCDQYILLHKLLLEDQIFGDTDLPRENVTEKFSNSDYKSTIMKKQFENLSRIRPMDLSKKSGKISAYDRMKVRLHNGDGSKIDNELDATFVEAYEEDITVILSKSPSKDSLNSFWKLVLEQNVSIIIWISEEKSETTEYWKDTNTAGSTYAIELEKEENLKNLKIQRLKFTGQETRLITHIHINIRKNEGEQQTISKITDGVNQLQKEMRECRGITLVHCKDGNGMSGVFGAMMNLLERLKVEDRVDVFRTVKDLRDCKEECVKCLHHYELCHQAILGYLGNFDTYSNFK